MGDEFKHGKDKIWDQHVRWLDLVSNESKSNELKREQRKKRSRNENPEDIARPSA